MVASVELTKMHVWAHEYDKSLRADNPRFRHNVHLIHEDGSVFFIMNAFIERKDNWLCVFSEHHRTVIYHIEDIYSCVECTSLINHDLQKNKRR